MHSNPSFFWSRGNSIAHSNHHRYQSEQFSVQKAESFQKERKVSPRVHKLSDPQRLNLPVQTYQRVCQRMPSSGVLHPVSQEKVYIADGASDYTPINSPGIENSSYRNKAQKVLSHHLSVTSCKTTSCSRKSSIKSPETPWYNHEQRKTFDEEGFSRDLSIVVKTPQQRKEENSEMDRSFKKQLSPRVSPFNNYGSTKTHLLECPSKEQKQYYSQRVGNEDHLSAQQLTFRSNAMTKVDMNGLMKAQDDREIEFESENGGFTTFRNLLGGEGLTEQSVLENQRLASKRVDTEGIATENKVSTQRVRFVCDENRDKENYEIKRELMNRETRRWSQADTQKDLMKDSNESKYNENFGSERKNGAKMRQQSMQWTPKEKVARSIDVLSCTRTLFQSAKTERGNIPHKQEKSIIGNSQCEDSEELRLKEMIVEMRKKLSEKNAEISEFKNRKKVAKISGNELDEKISQAVMAKKRSDDILEQLTQHIVCQEREMTFLSKCNQRLESILPNPNDYETNVESYLKKVREYEKILDQKQKEAKDVSAKVQSLEEESEDKVQSEKNKGKTEVRKLVLELKVREQEIKQLKEELQRSKTHMKGFERIGEKMLQLEQTQTQHIVENDRLKRLLPETEKLKFQKYLEDKSIASLILHASSEVNTIDEHAKNLTKILEAIMRGKRPPAEVMKLLTSLKKGAAKKINMIDRVTLSRDIYLKDLTRANVELTEVVHHRFMEYMDEICTEYARACGNQCSLQ